MTTSSASQSAKSNGGKTRTFPPKSNKRFAQMNTEWVALSATGPDIVHDEDGVPILEFTDVEEDESENAPVELKKAAVAEIQAGKKVYVKSLDVYAKVVSVKKDKNEAEILIGDIKSKVKLSDIFNPEDAPKEEKKVKIFNKSRNILPQTEINVIGKDSEEALYEVKSFLDQAVVNGIEEVKIIHGVGRGVLLKVIREYLKQDKNVKEMRAGTYGEGENGITIVKLK